MGRKDSVPSEFTILSASRSTKAPMAGPRIPGISTCPMIRMPWNWPARCPGMLLRIMAPNTAMPVRYPVIIKREPIKTIPVARPKYSSTYPAIRSNMEGTTEGRNPSRS